MRLGLFVFILCVALRGVQTRPDYKDPQAELEENQIKWNKRGENAYTMKITRQCDCSRDTPGEVTLTVYNDVIIASKPEIIASKPKDKDRGNFPTVDGVFDMIQKAINDGFDALSVDYDDELGYPTRAIVPEKESDEDEEIEYTIFDVKLGIGKQSKPMCNEDLISDRLSEMELSKKAQRSGFDKSGYLTGMRNWRKHLEQNNCVYKYKFTESHSCSEGKSDPLIISVVNGDVTDKKHESPTDIPGTPNPKRPLTITDLFKTILAKAQEADRVKIKYDQETGVPTKAFFDSDKAAQCDEITFKAELLTTFFVGPIAPTT